MNQVAWGPVARSSFQGRTRGIPSSISRENNVWSVCMSLRMNRINRPPLVGQKPIRCERKKKSVLMSGYVKFLIYLFFDKCYAKTTICFLFPSGRCTSCFCCLVNKVVVAKTTLFFSFSFFCC